MAVSSAPVIEAMPLTARGLRKRYDFTQVMYDINLQIAPGEVVGLIGRNGAGKSTLIRALLGLIEVDDGVAHVFDEPALTMSDRAKERLAYVPQQPSALGWMKVGHMFDYFGRFYPTWDKAFVDNALRLGQIPVDKQLAKLSPGERQRVELIRALAIRPQLLVLDEPAAALDPAARRELLRDIAVRAGDGGTTVLFSTHIVSDLERVASRILFLHDGDIILDTAMDDLKERFARIILRPEALPTGKMTGEIHRRTLQNDAVSVVIERSQGEDWPPLAQEPNAHLQPLGVEDLFVEVVQ